MFKSALLLLLTIALLSCRATGTTVGVTAGFGMFSFSTYGDFLASGPNPAYDQNRDGLRALLDGKYEEASEQFSKTLETYPDNPDAVFYQGITLIYLDDREAGFALLKTYRDPLRYEVTKAVRWWAEYLSKKPELTAKKIHEVLNRERMNAYKEHDRDRWDMLR